MLIDRMSAEQGNLMRTEGAKVLPEQWSKRYNNKVRPHSALSYRHLACGDLKSTVSD